MPTAPLNVAVFVSGRGSNLKALLDHKAAGGLANVEFRCVVSDAENPPAFEHARERGVPMRSFAPRSFRSKAEFESAILERLREMNVQFIVLAGYMRIVGPTLLAAFPRRIINIHPSLLPAFPGLHAQRQALEAGAARSGCTVHYVDAGVDTGEIILQREVPVLPGDTEETLSARILKQEHEALATALEQISQSRAAS